MRPHSFKTAQYTKIYGPGATNSGYGCASDFNAPIFTAIEEDGIGYKIQIDPDYNNSSSLEVTADIDIGLDIQEPSIRVFSSSGKLITEMVMDNSRSKVISNLKGKPKGSNTLKFWFKFPQHPSFRGEGSIQLPNLMVKGELREGIVLNFKQATKVGILPLNC